MTAREARHVKQVKTNKVSSKETDSPGPGPGPGQTSPPSPPRDLLVNCDGARASLDSPCEREHAPLPPPLTPTSKYGAAASALPS